METQAIPYGYCQCGCGGKTRISERSDSARGIVKGQPLRYIHPHISRPSTDPMLRFMAKVDVSSGPDGCWIWTGSRKHNGYGVFIMEGVTGRASRAAWHLFRWPIPDGLHVLHRCDNRPCVNPEHLFLGTPMDNSRDMVAKGRQQRRRGECANSSKLSEAQVVEMLAGINSGMSQAEAGRRYGVTDHQVWMIVHGRSWKHLTGRIA